MHAVSIASVEGGNIKMGDYSISESILYSIYE